MISTAEISKGLVSGKIDLMPIIETAKGVENATEIASASSRVRRVAFGGGDYTLDLDYLWGADEEVLSYGRARLSHVSRVAKIDPPIDTVVLQINDDERFLASAERGRKFGFGGKLCIRSICAEAFIFMNQVPIIFYVTLYNRFENEPKTCLRFI